MTPAPIRFSDLTEAELSRAGRFLERSRLWHAEHPGGFYSWDYDEQFEQLELPL